MSPNTHLQLNLFRSFLIAALIFLSSMVFSQGNTAVGLRLGDPMAFTFKKYLDNDNAWQINLGSSRWFRNNSYYKGEFGDWYNDEGLNYTQYEYLNVEKSFPLAIQAHYIFNNEITEWDLDGEGRLFWYWGFGGQLNYQTFIYDFRYKVSGDPNWYFDDSERVYDVAFGADVILGSEFIFSEIPLSVFAEIGLFTEIIEDPFFIRFQGGVGARYHF